jgi:uncharacterized protein YjbI with pentapeptide repeats
MKLLRLFASTLVVLVFMQADVPLKLLMLRVAKHCPGCRLVGADIKDMNLEGANLKNADLRWATLSSVNLNNADLSGANLRYARLDGVSIQNTNFCQATLMDSVKGACY